MNFMEVIGRMGQAGLPDFVRPGQIYYIDRDSIWIINGVSYGNVYALSGKFLSKEKLANFNSV